MGGGIASLGDLKITICTSNFTAGPSSAALNVSLSLTESEKQHLPIFAIPRQTNAFGNGHRTDGCSMTSGCLGAYTPMHTGAMRLNTAESVHTVGGHKVVLLLGTMFFKSTTLRYAHELSR